MAYTETERRILDMWPKFEDGSYVWFGDAYIDARRRDKEVAGVVFNDKCIYIVGLEGFYMRLNPSERVKHPAHKVLGADGVLIKIGDTVWGTKGGSYHLTSVHDGKVFARHVGGPFGAEVESAGGEGLYRLRADRLTHERTDADSWERLEKDADRTASLFDAFDSDASADIRDLVRRAKALAEKEAAR